MGRKRKTDTHLPRRMYPKHGSFYFVDRKNQWHPLGSNYAEALKAYAEFHQPQGTGTIGALIITYEMKVLPKQAPDTQKNRRREFANLRPVFENMRPQDLEAHHAYTYWEKRGSNRAARKEVAALSAVMSWARRTLGVIKQNPILNIGFPTAKPRDRYVTDEEFVKVRDCAPLMVRIAMNIELITAARQKDILGLTRSQVAAGVLKVVQSKTKRKVYFPVAGSLEENIQLALAQPPQLRQHVIVNRKGMPYTRDGFQTQWKRAVTKAFPNKEDRFTFHDVRAKSTSDADTLEEAQIRAGHANPQTTQKIYRRKPVIATVQDISHLKTKER